jgi:hypothetical protein
MVGTKEIHDHEGDDILLEVGGVPECDRKLDASEGVACMARMIAKRGPPWAKVPQVWPTMTLTMSGKWSVQAPRS